MCVPTVSMAIVKRKVMAAAMQVHLIPRETATVAAVSEKSTTTMREVRPAAWLSESGSAI